MWMIRRLILNRLKLELEIWKFRRDITLVTEVRRIDPDLPEINEVRHRARSILSRAKTAKANIHTLRRIDPDIGVEDQHGSLRITIGLKKSLLKPSSIARHHISYLDDALRKIVASPSAVIFYDERDCPLVTFCGPSSLAGLEEFYQLGLELIMEFTGLDLSWRIHANSTRSIVVVKANGQWRCKRDAPRS